MQQLILNIDENKYWVLLKFLKTLDYVKIVHPKKIDQDTLSPHQAPPTMGNQLQLLKQVLDQQTKPPFQNISDPAAWQKLQRDEWS